MFTFRKKKKRSQGTSAVVLSGEGIAYACVIQHTSKSPTLQSISFSPINERAKTTAVIKQFVKDNALVDKLIATTLLIADSNLVMLEKPDVAEDELRQAVRWKIKDSLSFDVSNAIIDVFEIPGLKERGRTPLVYVTAAEKSFLKKRLQMFAEQNLKVESIDIAELVMRNIAALLTEDSQGVALLKLDSDKGLMTLTQDASLYLARNLDIGYKALLIAPVQSDDSVNESDGLALEEGISSAQQRALDVIVLEVQRSLDYYESHFAKPAINSLVIAPLPYQIPGMINYLASALGIQVRMLDLNAILDTKIQMDEKIQANCFFAIGTALRDLEFTTSEKTSAEGKAA